MANAVDEDWETILAFLPNDWQEQARKLGAFNRARNFENPEALLRTLMLHLAQGCSLRETAIRARRGKIAKVSDVAVLKRLRASENWLRYLSESLRGTPTSAMLKKLTGKFNLCAVDATTVSEQGSTGSDWRLHYALDLATLACRHFSLTDTKTGESLLNFPVRENDLILADRAYNGIDELQHVLAGNADFLVRLRLGCCRLSSETGREFDPLIKGAKLAESKTASWRVKLFAKNKQPIIGRVCIYRRDALATAIAQKKVRSIAVKKGTKDSRRALEAAKYVALFTSLEGRILSSKAAFELYRLRWQIELSFKRLKSLSGFGHLPKYDAVSCRAWLYGKLFVGLLSEAMACSAFSP